MLPFVTQGPHSSSLVTQLLSLHNHFVRAPTLLAISVSDDRSEGSNQLNLMARLEGIFSVESSESFVQYRILLLVQCLHPLPSRGFVAVALLLV